ncbi:MAG: transketolase [Tissierellia bacterium]|nr:transketolase [Tissierellia bacterium]
MNIDNLTVNTIRVLSMEMVQKANSGHPGLPLGSAPMAYSLWKNCMNHNPKNPEWFNRDRFILAAGHGSALLYSLLHLFNYDVTMEDIKNFRQLGSKTPGHPEFGHTPGVEATSGPLGQGQAMAVGMALAESHLAAKFNKDGYNIVDHYTYVLDGDGSMMEGITNEAASFAGTNKLSKLIVLYDSNNITIEGDTDIAFKENVRERYEALGWDTFLVEDGNDIEKITATIEEAKKTDKPALIEIITKIGYGTCKEGSASSHGSPIGEEGIKEFKEKFGLSQEEFFVPEEVKLNMEKVVSEKTEKEEEWNKLYEEYKKAYPELAEELEKSINKTLHEEYVETEEFYQFDGDAATRALSGKVINRLADNVSNIIGGSADLAPSNKSNMDNRDSFSADNKAGSNIHFGIREHAMAAISNGISLHGGLIPYCATFFVFSDYMKPAMRMSAMMESQVIYVLTHDSIAVGEDGGTHQPIEQLAMLRSTPNMVTFRPADGKETAAAYSYAMNRKNGPTSIVLTRQKVKALDETSREALKGGYVLKDFGDKLDLVIIATGSEVELAMNSAEELNKKGYGVRVVSMPSMDLFEAQSEEYRNSVIPKEIRKRVSIEAAATAEWYKYVGLDGVTIGIDTFGTSAPGNLLFEKYGFTVENIVEKALNILK